MLAPAFAAIAMAIRLTDHGPVLFTQTRVGKNGGTFKIYKFRTMVVDAEAQQGRAGRAERVGGGVLFKMRRDPRITGVGGWLRTLVAGRAAAADQRGQGEMSLVGPRPALPAEAAKYGDHMQRRLMVRPGITGLWQVSGRSDLPWDEAVRLDLRYVENWSVALDLQILWKTAFAVIRGSGAY